MEKIQPQKQNIAAVAEVHGMSDVGMNAKTTIYAIYADNDSVQAAVGGLMRKSNWSDQSETARPR
jgi:hypothetical protein